MRITTIEARKAGPTPSRVTVRAGHLARACDEHGRVRGGGCQCRNARSLENNADAVARGES